MIASKNIKTLTELQLVHHLKSEPLKQWIIHELQSYENFLWQPYFLYINNVAKLSNFKLSIILCLYVIIKKLQKYSVRQTKNFPLIHLPSHMSIGLLFLGVHVFHSNQVYSRKFF